MAKCEQCGATIVLGSKSLAGYKFCSQKCVEDGKKSGLRETQEDIDAEISNPLIPLLAGTHAVLPLLLIYISTVGGTTFAFIGVVLFWSWFAWLWPLIGSRGSKHMSFKYHWSFQSPRYLSPRYPFYYSRSLASISGSTYEQGDA
jgi:hypothetical protein